MRKFPVFVSGVQPPGENLTITSTLAPGDDLTKVFSTTNTKVALPSGLQKILDGEAFKFDSLAEGLQQYLFYSETALRTASNDGEMPVVGKDLQAGADFMGKAREKLDAMLAVADPTTVGGATTMLKAKLAEMGVVVDGTNGIDVNFTCTRTLQPPSPAPTATASNAVAADTTEYVYKVVSVFKDGKLVEHDSIPSDPTDPVATNASTLSTAKFNTVAWTKVDAATGYRVLRAMKAAGGTVGTFTKVGTIADNTTVTFKDTGDTTDDAAYTAETKAYSRIPSGACESDTPVLQIEGVVVDLQLGQGKVDAKGCEDDLNEDGTEGKLGRCIGGELPVDLGIPGLSLKTGDGGAVKGSVGWNLDLNIGMSRSRGLLRQHQQGAEPARVPGRCVPRAHRGHRARAQGAAGDHRRRRRDELLHAGVRRPVRHRHQGRPERRRDRLRPHRRGDEAPADQGRHRRHRQGPGRTSTGTSPPRRARPCRASPPTSG